MFNTQYRCDNIVPKGHGKKALSMVIAVICVLVYFMLVVAAFCHTLARQLSSTPLELFTWFISLKRSKMPQFIRTSTAKFKHTNEWLGTANDNKSLC